MLLHKVSITVRFTYVIRSVYVCVCVCARARPACTLKAYRKGLPTNHILKVLPRDIIQKCPVPRNTIDPS